ncbi:MAG: CDF family Co(II)/Ni(II) efflux transporter DmeF [Desulfobacteraceae bacterium]|jgi:cation diffusion facilitator family transporter|nr:CDF family Co(II)/Ni(II) efflux transporter DmeF [Desulfobacteraceae bacterium]
MNRTEFTCPHEHNYLSRDHQQNERRTWFVIALTLITMAVEISSGILFGSMALLADGWHMASHASAMGITALAYYLARKHRDNPQFTFGTGKIGDLAGFSSALLLLIIAVLMAYESVLRLMNPVPIRFLEAIIVAVVGLIVNLSCAIVLKEQHHQSDAGHCNHDHNLRAAYLHVLADALTSILAIVGLGAGMLWGRTFLDPVMGIAGAVLISHWSWGLLRHTGSVLLDRTTDDHMAHTISDAVSAFDGVSILDLHVWRLGPGHFGAIVSLAAKNGQAPDDFKARLSHVNGLSHLTIEVNPSTSPAKTPSQGIGKK